MDLHVKINNKNIGVMDARETIIYCDRRAEKVCIDDLRVEHFNELLSKRKIPAPIKKVEFRPMVKLEKIIPESETVIWPPTPMCYRRPNVDRCMEVFIKNIRPTLIVVIEGKHYYCHNLLVRAISSFIRSLRYSQVIHLPSPMVSARTFVTIYRWAVERSAAISYGNLMELHRVGHFLGCDELIVQCLQVIEKETKIHIERNLTLYQSSKVKSVFIEKTLFGRLGPLFLPFVASIDFLQLEVDAISRLFHITTIGVNTEMEVLLAGVRWLGYQWPKREEHMEDALDGVRFELIPILNLLTLSRRIDGPPSFSHIAKNEVIKSRLLVALDSLYSKPDRYRGWFNREARLWIYDPSCPYHHTSNCDSVRFLGYNTFTRYLKRLHKIGKDYWNRVQSINSKTICCKANSDNDNNNHNINYFRSK